MSHTGAVIQPAYNGIGVGIPIALGNLHRLLNKLHFLPGRKPNRRPSTDS